MANPNNITKRAVKGSFLSYEEMDANWQELIDFINEYNGHIDRDVAEVVAAFMGIDNNEVDVISNGLVIDALKIVLYKSGSDISLWSVDAQTGTLDGTFDPNTGIAGLTPSGSVTFRQVKYDVKADFNAKAGNAVFATFADLGTGATKDGVLDLTTIQAMHTAGTKVRTEVNNLTSNSGGAEYSILTTAEKNAAGYTGTEGYACIEINGSGYWACLNFSTKKLRLSQFGALFGVSNDDTDVVIAARNFCQNGRADLILDGQFRITDEIAFNADINIYGTKPSTYNAHGTVIWVDVNDVAKTGFYFGKTKPAPILCRFYGAKFITLSNCWSAMRDECATFFGGDYHFDSNGGIGNGLYIAEHYIGSIERVEVTGNVYGLKITGNTSCTIRDVNVNASPNGASLQIASMPDGHLKLQDIYLEAQSTQNLAITDCDGLSTITIDGVYEENSAIETIIQNSNCVEIKNFRTNAATKGIKVQGNSQSINIEIKAVDRFEANPVLVVADGCDVTASITYNSDDTAVDGRDYALVVGELSGGVTKSANTNSKLFGSANNTLLQFSNGAMNATVPSSLEQKVSGHSILLNSGEIIRLPLTSWRKNKRYVIKCVYQSETASENAFQVRIQNGTQVKLFQSFHVPDPAFRTLYFVFTTPNADVDEYTALDFYNVSGSCFVHYLGMAECDSGNLPSIFDDNELVTEKTVDLSVSGLSSLLDSTQDVKFSRYEITNDSTVTSATVKIGSCSAVPVQTDFITFNIGNGVVGTANNSAISNQDLKDHRNRQSNGITCTVSSVGTGKVVIRSWYKLCDTTVVN